MITFLRFGRFSVKKLRIAFSLLRVSIKAVFFDHHRYFVYCFLLTLIQFITLLSTGFIHSKLRLSVLISESMAGLNFFEILFESVSHVNVTQILFLVLLLFFELFLIYFVCSAVSCYARVQWNGEQASIAYSFKRAAKKLGKLGGYALLETVILFLCALLGVVGNMIYFGWQLLTVFNIQFISFEPVSVLGALYRSAQFFLKNVTQALSIDALIELALVLSMSIVYYFSQQSLLEPIKSVSENYFITFFLLYLLSVLYVLENVTFTLLYVEIKENRS